MLGLGLCQNGFVCPQPPGLPFSSAIFLLAALQVLSSVDINAGVKNGKSESCSYHIISYRSMEGCSSLSLHVFLC